MISQLLLISVNCPRKVKVSLQWFLFFVNKTWFLQPQLTRHHKFLIENITPTTLIDSLRNIQTSCINCISLNTLTLQAPTEQLSELWIFYNFSSLKFQMPLQPSPPQKKKNKWISLSQQYPPWTWWQFISLCFIIMKTLIKSTLLRKGFISVYSLYQWWNEVSAGAQD